jgi:F420-dependent oxidoreductase-like protein
MHAITLDHLSNGRLILGLGVSGPQVVEGWYGRPSNRPLARTREYVEIIRRVMAREAPVEFDGEFFQHPYHGEGSTGLGKPLKPITHPLRREIPIFLGAEGPKNVALAAELCDGWLALFFSPANEDIYRSALDEGFGRPGARRSRDDFEIAAGVPLIVTDDAESAVDAVRPMYALYFGGMGAKSVNFHANVAIRMGYEEEVRKIQDLYLDGKKDEAAAALPTKLIRDLTLIGSKDEIRDQLDRWRESIATTLLVAGDPATLRTAAELVLG